MHNYLGMSGTGRPSDFEPRKALLSTVSNQEVCIATGSSSCPESAAHFLYTPSAGGFKGALRVLSGILYLLTCVQDFFLPLVGNPMVTHPSP